MMVDLVMLANIAREEFVDIVVDVRQIDAKLRMLLVDGSYIDSRPSHSTTIGREKMR